MADRDPHGRRTALVTGAGSGLGRATSVRLAAGGSRVACLDIDEARADATADQIRAAGGAALAVRCDVTSPGQISDGIRETVAWGGGLDVAVNAAGVGSIGRTAEVAIEEWQRVLEINLTGTFLVCQRALEPLLDGGGGAVVNVASIAGLSGWRYMAAYAASKGGIVALTRSLAVEYARHGIRFNCVAPGSIDTPLAAALQPPDDADPAVLGRGGALTDPPVSQPEEIADAIAYLASPAARFVVGSVLVIDGGATL